jgi:integrase
VESRGGSGVGRITLSDLEARDVRRALSRSLTPGAQLGATLSIAWGHLKAHLVEANLEALTNADLQGYVEERRLAGVRSQTISRELAALARGLKLAGAPVPEMPRLRADTPKASQAGHLLTVPQIRAWVDALPPDFADLALVALSTGLRREEIARLQLAWLALLPLGSPVAAYLMLPTEATKSRKARTIGISSEGVAALHRCHPRMAELMGTYRRASAKAAKVSGLPFAPHLRSLRHCYATMALQGTADPSAVQAALGHSDLRMANRYLSSTVDRTASAAAAVSVALAGGPRKRGVPA